MSDSLVQQIGHGGADGYQFPNVPVGFYGSTPVSQQAVGSVVSTSSISATGGYGFVSSTQANAVVQAVAAIQTALKNLGMSS